MWFMFCEKFEGTYYICEIEDHTIMYCKQRQQHWKRPGQRSIMKSLSRKQNKQCHNIHTLKV